MTKVLWPECLLILPQTGCYREESPPVPRSIWNVLVLGQAEAEVGLALPDSNSSRVKFGIITTENPDVDRLGLGHEFAHKEHRLISGCVPIPKKANPEATDSDSNLRLGD